MNEKSINEVLSKIRDEIVEQAGHGFTVEINAEVTKYEVYKLKRFPSLGEELFKNQHEPTWKFSKEVRNKKYISIFYRRVFTGDYCVCGVDLDLSITKELETQLPYGIDISKRPNSVLYDGREFRVTGYAYDSEVSSTEPVRSIHLKHISETDVGFRHEYDGRKTCYIEGNRVYLTVSDEYAKRIFNEICNSQYPFRNYLLENHDQVLRDIASKLVCYNYTNAFVCVTFSEVQIQSGGFSGFDDGYPTIDINYGTFGLTNLKTYEQLYGMAFALIDTKEKINPEWKNARIAVFKNEATSSVIIAAMFPPREPIQPTNQLKEW